MEYFHSKDKSNSDLMMESFDPSEMERSTAPSVYKPRPVPRPVPRPRKQVEQTSNRDEVDRRPLSNFQLQNDVYDHLFRYNSDIKSSVSDNKRIKDDRINVFRDQIKTMILQNSPQDARQNAVYNLLSLNCQIEEKYEILDLIRILKENERCIRTKIPQAFNILEKYATNLLKPVQNRHLSWRTVQFTTIVFKQKLKFLEGHINIFRTLGYTESIKEENGNLIGVAFPLNMQPNEKLVQNLAVDLTIAKFEVEAILTSRHPNIKMLQYKIPLVFMEYGFNTEGKGRDEMRKSLTYESLGSNKNSDSFGSESKVALALNKPILSDNFDRKANAMSEMTTPGYGYDFPSDLTKPIKVSIPNEQASGINVSDKKCSKCGTVCDFKAKFCSECGVPLVEKMPLKAVEKMPSKAINVVQTMKGNAQSRVKKLDQMWQCVHCTFMNPFETTVCGMCDRTSWKTSVDMKHADAEQSNKSSDLINQAADKKDQKQDGTIPTSKQSIPESPYEQKDIGQYILVDKKETAEKEKINAALQMPTKSAPTTVSDYKQSGILLEQPQSPISPMLEDAREKMELRKRQEREHQNLRECQLREEAIAKQKEMQQNAQLLVSLMKCAEKNGFSVDECYLATQFVNERTEQNIINWLKQDWSALINEVVSLCTDLLSKDETIGLLSFEEGKKMLLSSDGKKERAVQLYIEGRRWKVAKLNEEAFENKNILTALHNSNGDVKKARLILINKRLERFRERIWSKNQPNMFYEKLNDETLPLKVKHRMLIGEHGLTLGRAMNCMKLVKRKEFMEEDCIEAAKNNQHYDQCLNYLNHECLSCFFSYPVHKLFVNLSCQCCFCIECYTTYIKITLSEKHIRHLICPMCQQPNLETPPAHYFDNLGQQIKHLVKEGQLQEKIYETFDTKLRDFFLLKEENFRWCAHCGNGFLWDDLNQIRMTCNKCQQRTCFKCKEKWEEQHESLTCERFRAWKAANDPELQQAGVAALLAKNGLECPECKFRYDLARGGCMHFKCTQCGFEFCSGCSQGFRQGAQCQVHQECAHMGLHAHHPRDCLNYLRDRSVEELQELLAKNDVAYDTEIPEEKKIGDEPVKCDMMEQKEIEGGYKDEHCGRDAPENMAGICQKHYLEYLVALINLNGLDPVYLMTADEMVVVYKRKHEEAPPKDDGESDEDYIQRLRQDIRDKFPLPARKDRMPLPELNDAAQNNDVDNYDDDVNNYVEDNDNYFDDNDEVNLFRHSDAADTDSFGSDNEEA